MNPTASTEDVYEERTARFVELAEAAQRAAETAAQQARPRLQETYAIIAQHWLTLAKMAQGMLELNRKIAQQKAGRSSGDQLDRLH